MSTIITDYQVVGCNKVQEFLKEGWQPWKNPFQGGAPGFYYQALVKVATKPSNTWRCCRKLCDAYFRGVEYPSNCELMYMSYKECEDGHQ